MVTRIDIVLATRNRSAKLRNMLASLSALPATPDLDTRVIAVDNGSSDDTEAVLEAWSAKLNLVHLFEERPGKNAALNAGLNHIRGDLIVFTDDDVAFDEKWLQALHIASMTWAEANVFGGRVHVSFPPGTPAWMKSPRFRFRGYAFAAFAPDIPAGPGDFIPVGPNYAVRRSALEGLRFNDRVGPQDKNYRMGSETELLWRLKDRGHLFAYVPDAVITHQIDSHQVQVDHLLQRAFNAGRGYEVLGLQGRLPGQGHKPLTLRKAYLKRAFYRLMWVLCGWVSDAASFRWRSKVRFYDGRIHEKRLGAGAPEDDAVSRPDPSAHTQ